MPTMKHEQLLWAKAAKVTPEEELAIRALLYEDTKETEKVGAAYPGNLGAVEMLRFYRESNPRQQKLMDDLLDENKFQEAWELLKQVTGIKLKDPKWISAAAVLAGHREVQSYKNLHAYWDTEHSKWRIYGVYDADTENRDDVGRILYEKNTLTWTVEVYPNSPSDEGRRKIQTFTAADDREGVKRALMSLGEYRSRMPRVAAPVAPRNWKAQKAAKAGSGKFQRVARSNAKVVEVPSNFHQVVLQEPKATRKEFPFEGYIDFQGIKIDVENAKGSTRSGTGPEGDWSIFMNAHYGEIRGTEGTDGDKLDVYVGDNHDSSLVVVIHQHNPWDGKYDEDKVVLGCDSIEEAIGLYKSQYDRPGFYREGEHTAMPIGAFWRWVTEERNKGKKVKMARTANVWLTEHGLTRDVLQKASILRWFWKEDNTYITAKKMPDGRWDVRRVSESMTFDTAPKEGRLKTDDQLFSVYQKTAPKTKGITSRTVQYQVAAKAPESPTVPEPVVTKAPAAPTYTPKELQDRESVSKRTKGLNPFIYSAFSKPENGFQIGFTVPRLSEPLWWTGSGFKNLSMGRGEPETFKTRAEAEHKVRSELLKFIKQWRADDAYLIMGWDGPAFPRVAPPQVKAPPAPEPAAGSFTADEVTSFLRSMSTRQGGPNRSVERSNSSHGPFWSAEPQYRQRLDHFVGRHYHPGPDDDPEGWDSDGWEEEYAGPLREEVQKKLDARFGKGVLMADVGEKGHIDVQLGSKGRSLMRTAALWRRGALEGQPGALNTAKVVLSNLLAYLRALGWNHLTSHWQVAGDTFYGDHLLFERLYGKVVEETDGLAEKLVGLFGKSAVEGAEQAKLMAFAMYQASSTGCPYQRGLQMERAFQVMVKKSLDALEAVGHLSLGLDDMLRTMANDHETNIYLLQQRLGGVKVASARGSRPDPVQRLATKYLLRSGSTKER